MGVVIDVDPADLEDMFTDMEEEVWDFLSETSNEEEKHLNDRPIIGNMCTHKADHIVEHFDPVAR